MRLVAAQEPFTDHPHRFHPHSKYATYPAKMVPIRGLEEETYAVVDVTKLNKGGLSKILEEVEISRALFEVRKIPCS